jgi:dTDP-4-amino-4,6-dideoxygalactose transaminase
MGFDIKNHPISYQQYINEISLPIYPQLSNENISYILKVVCESIEQVLYAQESF